MDKSKAEEIPWWKNWGKKSRPNENRKSTILLKKEKKSLVKATGTGGAPRWRPDSEQRSRRQTKICDT